MIRPALLVAALCLGMVLPHLPGRYDASAVSLSFLIQVGSYASLLLVPVGLAWIVSRRRARLWYNLTWLLAGWIALVAAAAAVAVNLTAVGLLLGVGAVGLWKGLHPRTRLGRLNGERLLLPVCLAVVPALLVIFLFTVLPIAADWSRQRAIQHCAPLISQIESFRQRRGRYPESLQSLNRDFPTGVVGIERFLYEVNGEAYNLYFVRQHLDLDAQEVVMFNPRHEHRFAAHELDILQYDGEQLDLRRGDRRQTPLAQPHWVSILFD
ncbi:MAG: hypothetical protein Kow001_12650 [Acidobacteriota bacterium]